MQKLHRFVAQLMLNGRSKYKYKLTILVHSIPIVYLQVKIKEYPTYYVPLITYVLEIEVAQGSNQ